MKEIIKYNCSITGSAGRGMLTDIHYIPDRIKKTVVIYVHGFNGFKDWGNMDMVAKQFAAEHFLFVKTNLSHNGTTQEQPEVFNDLEAYAANNYSKELFDVGCIIDWVSDPAHPLASEIDTSKLVLLGHSLGGGIAILKAAHDKRIKSLITWASVGECKTPWGSWDENKLQEWKEKGRIFIENKRTKQQMPLDYQLVEDYQQNQSVLDIENAFKKMKIPMLLCHGTQDEAVPYSVFQQFQQWRPDAGYLKVDSDHVFGRRHPFPDKILPQPCLEVIAGNIEFLKKLK